MHRAALLPPAPAPPLAALIERAKVYAADSRAPSTRRGYLTDFAAFEAWCARHSLCAMPAPAPTVAVYLSTLADAGRRPSTITRALSGIAHAHRTRGHTWQRQHPAVIEVMAGIRHRLGVAPSQKAPVIDTELAQMLGAVDPGLRGLRDRALLTMGWWGAFRRSELVALCADDVTRVPEGLSVHLRRSKTDQAGRGAYKAIPRCEDAAVCPVRALDAWLAASCIEAGPLFRGLRRGLRIMPDALSDRSVALIVQRIAERVGLNPRTLAGHSLRAGFATTAATHGGSIDEIMRQTLHKDQRVARGYVRNAGLFTGNAAVRLASRR